MSGYC
jgi:transposase